MQCFSGCLSCAASDAARFLSVMMRIGTEVASREKEAVLVRDPTNGHGDDPIPPRWTEDREDRDLDADFVRSLQAINAKGVRDLPSSKVDIPTQSCESAALRRGRQLYDPLPKCSREGPALDSDSSSWDTISTCESAYDFRARRYTTKDPKGQADDSSTCLGDLPTGIGHRSTSLLCQLPKEGIAISISDAWQRNQAQNCIIAASSGPHPELWFCRQCGDYYVNIRKHVRQCHPHWQSNNAAKESVQAPLR
eukprot:gnl/TRDRNA2_/TRDRNA2_189639_c0_seq1.p1 gnl/TRDRNA2_/TRDRNA2_189639_c0~~gnl/TRDRNA2_/TRDRNA2_189639_c0_seq1.p1  ORF type:complete len:251 (-),score=18.80 gnl/TRDRNA2_/TRDRNA2_189639_c0_seq1:32-784(-)